MEMVSANLNQGLSSHSLSQRHNFSTERLGRATIGPSGAELYGVRGACQGSVAHAKRDAKGGAP